MGIFIPHPMLEADRPVRRAVRRMRWFRQSFAEQVDVTSRTDGVLYRIRDDRLAQAYVVWLRAFEAQKPRSPAARRSYTNFASGLMLREFIRSNPLDVLAVPAGSDLSNPAYYWPEGYVYVGYCLNVRSAVLLQEFGEKLTLSPDLLDIRVWWSFKENVAEDLSLAIPFLDFFAGERPDWEMPSVHVSGRRERVIEGRGEQRRELTV